MDNYVTPEVELPLDSVIWNAQRAENNKKELFKKFKEVTNMNKEYNYFEQNAYMSANLSEKVATQINDLWQEIKRLKSQHLALLAVAEKQREMLDKLLVMNKENDTIQEIKDRLDDLESKIDLLDE